LLQFLSYALSLRRTKRRRAPACTATDSGRVR